MTTIDTDRNLDVEAATRYKGRERRKNFLPPGLRKFFFLSLGAATIGAEADVLANPQHIVEAQGTTGVPIAPPKEAHESFQNAPGYVTSEVYPVGTPQSDLDAVTNNFNAFMEGTTFYSDSGLTQPIPSDKILSYVNSVFCDVVDLKGNVVGKLFVGMDAKPLFSSNPDDPNNPEDVVAVQKGAMIVDGGNGSYDLVPPSDSANGVETVSILLNSANASAWKAITGQDLSANLTQVAFLSHDTKKNTISLLEQSGLGKSYDANSDVAQALLANTITLKEATKGIVDLSKYAGVNKKLVSAIQSKDAKGATYEIAAGQTVDFIAYYKVNGAITLVYSDQATKEFRFVTDPSVTANLDIITLGALATFDPATETLGAPPEPAKFQGVGHSTIDQKAGTITVTDQDGNKKTYPLQHVYYSQTQGLPGKLGVDHRFDSPANVSLVAVYEGKGDDVIIQTTKGDVVYHTFWFGTYDDRGNYVEIPVLGGIKAPEEDLSDKVAVGFITLGTTGGIDYGLYPMNKSAVPPIGQEMLINLTTTSIIAKWTPAIRATGEAQADLQILTNAKNEMDLMRTKGSSLGKNTSQVDLTGNFAFVPIQP